MNRRAYEVALPILTLVTSFGAVLGLGYTFEFGPSSQPSPTPTPTPTIRERPAPPATPAPSRTTTTASEPGASKLVVTVLNRHAGTPLPGLLVDRPTVPGQRQLCLVDARVWQPENPIGWSSPPDAPNTSCLSFPSEGRDPITFVLVRR